MFDIERVRASWQKEAAAIDALVLTMNEHTAAEPIRGDGWSAHDLLGHVANAARAFLAYIRGERTEAIDVHAANDAARERGRARSWAEVQAYWQRARDEVSAFLASCDNTAAEQPASLPWVPQIKTVGDAVRALILHTRSHRQELEQGHPEVQA